MQFSDPSAFPSRAPTTVQVPVDRDVCGAQSGCLASNEPLARLRRRCGFVRASAVGTLQAGSCCDLSSTIDSIDARQLNPRLIARASDYNVQAVGLHVPRANRAAGEVAPMPRDSDGRPPAPPGIEDRRNAARRRILSGTPDERKIKATRVTYPGYLAAWRLVAARQGPRQMYSRS